MSVAARKALIFGVANERSLAWSIATALKAQGFEIGLSYAIPALERRVKPLAERIGATLLERCDVTSDAEIDAVFEHARNRWGGLDVLVHSLAFADAAELEQPFLKTSRKGFALALDISAYSLIALAQRAVPLMLAQKTATHDGQPADKSILTLTNSGSTRVIPGYNVMGAAKAALESSVRYLAAELGPSGIRVNAISAGPVKTLAAMGISGFGGFMERVATESPLRSNIEGDDVGALAAFLASPAARKITGSLIPVDSGVNIIGA